MSHAFKEFVMIEMHRKEYEMELKDKLLKLRKEKGMSQQELANELNVSRQSISKWKLGESQPELNNIVMISELYHVSTDYLLKDIIVNDQKENETCQKVFVISVLMVLFGVISTHILWNQYQNSFSLLVGMFIQIVGIGIFEYFVITLHNDQIHWKFWSICIWLVTLLPVKYFVTYTQTFNLFYMKFSSMMNSHFGIIYMYLPLLIAMFLSGILFILIRKAFK